MLQFDRRWNYPGCIRAVDGKHIRIQKPSGRGSLFYNYKLLKHYCSLVLMAVVNGNYKFLYVDVGAEGRSADGGTWGNCDFKKAIDAARLNIPPGVRLHGNKNISCHFVGNDVFSLTTHMLKPFPHRFLTEQEKVFNNRLSRARRVMENFLELWRQNFKS